MAVPRGCAAQNVCYFEDRDRENYPPVCLREYCTLIANPHTNPGKWIHSRVMAFSSKKMRGA